MRKIVQIIFIGLGIFCVILGVIGIVIPVLPTTPLLLLASVLFLKSSSKLNRRLLESRFPGEYLRDYINHRAIRRRAKIISIVFLWIMLSVSACLVDILVVRIILLLVGIGVTVHLVCLKTLEKVLEQDEEANP